MSGTEIEIANEQEQRDEQVAEAISGGKSLRSVKRQFGLSQSAIDAALERLWPIDTASRLQMIKADVGQIMRLTQVFVEKGLAGDTQSCLCAVRLFERKHELLGLNAAAKFEVVTQPREVETGHDKIRRVIWNLARPGQPMPDDIQDFNQQLEESNRQLDERRAAIQRLDQLGPTRALELLGPYEGNGDGTEPQ